MGLQAHMVTGTVGIGSWFQNPVDTYTNKMQSTIAVYVPLGIDFKMGTKKSFWKPIHVFFETRLSIQYYNIPELDSRIQGNAYNAFGIRYKIGGSK